ncbi:hypothetical protein BCON_0174g00120 [Botryotinia convoluta]|uniref:Uncharacterized protein n=1 Tax=Botryotinia convoluta TaxID=54673 RepID=A0A4Z1HP45_9HELO|nr:hypothetical protein BCON_0174g00120 [Botryotinia convoluta]
MQTLPGITLYGQPEKNGIYDQQEIVTLITQYYELLAKMRDFPASYIKYAPYDPPIDVDLAKSFDLEPQVIELLQALPYIEGYSNEDEFILGGSFADMRDLEVLMQSRDPGFASPEGGFDDENGEYMRPWEICINECGNHGTMMFLDTRNGESHITMEGQDSGHSEDSGVYNFPGVLRSRNRNSHDHLPSRHARELFEDFTNRLLKLQWIPSSEDRRMLSEWDEEYEDLRLLFRTYGWPHNFNHTSFDSAYSRWREFLTIKSHACDSASDIIDQKLNLDSATESLNSHSKRVHMGVWDRDPGKHPEEISMLETILEENREIVNEANEMLEKAIADHGDWKGERAEMIKAWRKHFENDIEREERNLEWWRGEGKAHSKEEEIEETREKIRVLKGRLANVGEQPVSVEEPDGVKFCDFGEWGHYYFLNPDGSQLYAYGSWKLRNNTSGKRYWIPEQREFAYESDEMNARYIFSFAGEVIFRETRDCLRDIAAPSLGTLIMRYHRGAAQAYSDDLENRIDSVNGREDWERMKKVAVVGERKRSQDKGQYTEYNVWVDDKLKRVMKDNDIEDIKEESIEETAIKQDNVKIEDVKEEIIKEKPTGEIFIKDEFSDRVFMKTES